jgi:hypothetical protein
LRKFLYFIYQTNQENIMADAGKPPPPKEPAREEYDDSKGKGEEGFKSNQKAIENLTGGTDGKKIDQESKEKEDRVDAKGTVYSWDKDADGGKGAWGVSGKLSEEDNKKRLAGEDTSDKIQWYTDQEYEKASGLSNEPGKGGYTDEYDIKK